MSMPCAVCEQWQCGCGKSQEMQLAQQAANGYGQTNAKQYQPKDAKAAPVVHAEGIWRIEGFGLAVEAPTLVGVLELAQHVEQLRSHVKR